MKGASQKASRPFVLCYDVLCVLRRAPKSKKKVLLRYVCAPSLTILDVPSLYLLPSYLHSVVPCSVLLTIILRPVRCFACCSYHCLRHFSSISSSHKILRLFCPDLSLSTAAICTLPYICMFYMSSQRPTLVYLLRARNERVMNYKTRRDWVSTSRINLQMYKYVRKAQPQRTKEAQGI